MNTLTIVAFACLAVFAAAKPSGIDYYGGLDDGHSNVVHGNGATLVGAHAGHASIVGPSRLGLGLGSLGLGHGLIGGLGHGVVVRGPPTVPATIVGPSGKIHADGLWGPTHVYGLHGIHL